MRLYEEYPWYAHAGSEREYLNVNRYKYSETTSPKKRAWTPEEVDYEMSFGRHPTKMCVCTMTQKCFEYWVSKYGANYESIYLNNAVAIRDLSPLADLPNLKSITVEWCRAEGLWDMSRNTKLKNLALLGAKKISANLGMLKTGKSLENILVQGDMDVPYLIPTLDVFANLPDLKRIDFLHIKVGSHDVAFLETLPSLEQFHFDPGMLTTEEIAYICAKYPDLCGCSLGAYTTGAFGCMNDVRICGYRKPGLDLPEQQKRFDKYVAEFNALVEKYKKEMA